MMSKDGQLIIKNNASPAPIPPRIGVPSRLMGFLPDQPDPIMIESDHYQNGFQWEVVSSALREAGCEWIHSPTYGISLLKKGCNSVIIDKEDVLFMRGWTSRNIRVQLHNGEGAFRPSKDEFDVITSHLNKINTYDQIDHLGPSYEWLCKIAQSPYDPDLKNITLDQGVSVYMQMPDTPLNRYISEQIYICLVARILMPGIDIKKSFVLGGDSNSGKTHFFKYALMPSHLWNQVRVINPKRWFDQGGGDRKKREDLLDTNIVLFDEYCDIISIGSDAYKALISETELKVRGVYKRESKNKPFRYKNIITGTFNLDDKRPPLPPDPAASIRSLVISPVSRIPDQKDGFIKRQSKRYQNHFIKLAIDRVVDIVKSEVPDWDPLIEHIGHQDPLGGFAMRGVHSIIEKKIIGVQDDLKEDVLIHNKPHQHSHDDDDIKTALIEVIRGIIYDDVMIDRRSAGYVENSDIPWCFSVSAFRNKLCELAGMPKPSQRHQKQKIDSLISRAGFKVDRCLKKTDKMGGVSRTTALKPPAYIQLTKTWGLVSYEVGHFSVKNLKKLISQSEVELDIDQDDDRCFLSHEDKLYIQNQINLRIIEIDRVNPEFGLIEDKLRERWHEDIKNSSVQMPDIRLDEDHKTIEIKSSKNRW